MKRSLYNVRYFHTYVDEDMIGTCKGLARRVHRKMLEFRLLGRFLLRLSTYKQGRTNKLLRGLKSRPVKTKKVAAPAPRKKSHMSFQYYIKIYIFECYHFLHTDDIYILMLLYKWTLVNVGSICIRSSVWDIYIFIYKQHIHMKELCKSLHIHVQLGQRKAPSNLKLVRSGRPCEWTH